MCSDYNHDGNLATLLAAAGRHDRDPDLVWPAAAAAIELLWWNGDYAQAGTLAQDTLRGLAENPGKLHAQDVPFVSALIVGAVEEDQPVTPALAVAAESVPATSVLGDAIAWVRETLGDRDPFELVSGYQWKKPAKPFNAKENELAQRPVDSLDAAERARLWSACHSRKQYLPARRLLDETGEPPPRWFIATWLAGHLVPAGETTLATTILDAALDTWIPYQPWDLAPTDVVLQPRLRPAVTPALRDKALGRVELTGVKGLA